MSITDDAIIAAMAEERARCERALAYGRMHGLFDAGAAVGDYLAAVRECPLDRPTLGAARDALCARLERGMAAPASPAVDELFARLLGRLATVYDALDVDGCRRRLGAKLARMKTPEAEAAVATLRGRAGGESGPVHRPMDPAWARDLRDQCQAAGVAYFFKQSSGTRPGQGRELDGRLWEAFPATAGREVTA